MNTKKRIELYLWILIFFVGLHISGTAQSLQLSFYHGVIYDNDQKIQFVVYANVIDSVFIGVTNTTMDSVAVMVEKEEIHYIPYFAENWFFWGKDHGVLDYFSAAPVIIPPTVTETFIGKVDFKGDQFAEAIIRYRFFLEEAPEDYVSVRVYYLANKIDFTDIKPHKEEAIIGLSAYPNPAGPQVTFAYGLPEEAKDAEVVIYNATGVVVKNIRLPLHEKEYTVNIENLSSGMYFYHVVVDGQRSEANKLSIQH